MLCACCGRAGAQTTITAASFPKASDTLYYAIDAAPAATINAITPPGGNQTWDFSSLKPTQREFVVYFSVNKGVHKDKFPGADLVTISSIGAETYFNVTSTKMENMGIVTNGIGPITALTVTRYQPALVERRAPVNFFDINQQSTNISLPFSAQDLPQALLANLPVKPDSIRIRSNIQRFEVVDAWGNCVIPGGTYPVLRSKSTEYVSRALDVKVGFLGWIDASAVLGSTGGGALGQFLGVDTTVTYRFLNDQNKTEIAIVTLNNAQNAASRVRFKDNRTTSISENPLATLDMQLYPNPAVDQLRFECAELPAGEYTLRVFDRSGKLMRAQDYQSAGQLSLTFDVRDFPEGAYFCRWTDRKGNAFGGQAFEVVR